MKQFQNLFSCNLVLFLFMIFNGIYAGDIIGQPLFADVDTGIYPYTFVGVWYCDAKWINSHIRGSKQGVTNLSHAEMMFVRL